MKKKKLKKIWKKFFINEDINNHIVNINKSEKKENKEEKKLK